MAGQSLVDVLHSERAVVAHHIDAVYVGTAPSPREYVLDFSAVQQLAADGFVGRESVFADLERFFTEHDRGYFEIVAEAGLGKTALAAEIARRANAIPFFASASGGHTRPEQFLTHMCGALITRHNLDYDHLPARAGSDAAFLDCILREVSGRGPGRREILVVDALDEADDPHIGANPLLLPPSLPARVYVVVTRRPPAPELLRYPGTPVRRRELRRDDPEQDADIAAFLRSRLAARTPGVTAPPGTADDLVTRLTAASEGNFMYLSYVLADLAADGSRDAFSIGNLPRGLSGYYERFWAQMQTLKAEGWPDWSGLYRPVIERLAVAAEPVSATWLAAQLDRDPDEISERALQRWERLLTRARRNGTDSWALVHRSCADFLTDRVDLVRAHLAVARYYLAQDWSGWDDYGLRHAVGHGIAAAAVLTAAERGTLVTRLATLVADPRFVQEYLHRIQNPAALERDLEVVMTAAAEEPDIPNVPVLAQVAWALVGFRRQQRRLQPIIESARRGDLSTAERWLDIFAADVDRDWYAALLLILAWLSHRSNPGQARKLRQRVQDRMSTSPTLAHLAARVDADMDDTPFRPPVLPPPPTPNAAQAMVQRLSGSYDESLLHAYGLDQLPRKDEITSGGFFLAEHDGPHLVALAASAPDVGEPLLQRYVDLHAVYGYGHYRTGSLWVLLEAILQHPDQAWVRTWAPKLGAAVLAPTRGQFCEGMEIAALARLSMAGVRAARQELETRWNDTLAVRAQPLPEPGHGRSDVWGMGKRRALALAEALSRIPDRDSVACRLIREIASHEDTCFAGFQARANLTVAEAALIVMPHDADVAAQAIESARAAAHSVQDPPFCAVTTARVNAMRVHWWPALPAGQSVLEVIARLRKRPAGAEFTAVHIVGEAYERRDAIGIPPLPSSLLEADTLAGLSGIYQRGLPEFLELNADGGWSGDQALPSGAQVNVPDPGFAPLLAAWLSAQVLVDSALTDHERVKALQWLVPIAVRDVTCLDAVLARLVLACPELDQASLEQIQQLGTRNMADTPQDFNLPGVPKLLA